MASRSSLKRKKAPEDDDDENEVREDMDVSDEEGSLRIDGIYIPPPPKPIVSIATTGTRLIITKISNYFFKSYANEQVLGPFHKCFNAIIGPNGSGKSNVIDAMLFVFGYRASKLRSKKLPLLLHNSERYQNVQSCTVAVHFAIVKDKEGDEYEILPNGTFVISRTANRDNSSYYEINGKKAHFKEVAKMLRNYGVDLDHNRFLILQGEVEQIAMMKCKATNEHETGMLEYLEDIIGTSRYKQPLAKLGELVEVLADRRSEQLNRVKIVQKELEELKKPMDEAVEFLTLENSITIGKNFIFQRLICDLNEKIKQTEEDMSEFSTAQQELETKLDKVASEKSSTQSTVKDVLKTHEEMCKKHENLKEAFDKANNIHVRLQADMVQLNNTRKKTKEMLNEERKKLAELELIPQKNERTITECVAKEKEMSEKKETMDNEKVKLLASLRVETQELQEKKEVLQTSLVELNKVVDETKSALTLAESELKIYVSNEETETKKFESLQTTYETMKQTIKQRTQQINELKKKIPLTDKSLREALNDLQSVKIQEAQLIEKIRSNRSNLTQLRSSMQDSRSRGRVLDSLTQQKREGNCPGLFGRLGDLGAIDQKYDVAVSTACGPLDNIVVDTVSTAQWCIEFLKEYNIGRATFIALEKQEHLRDRANNKIKTPEKVHRLFDLIRIEDERVKTAFYYALRDTLVANDLDQASRIAYGAHRYRVVTLAGQLIETIGTMSGGGSVSRGRMGQSVKVTNKDPRELERMENDLKHLEEQTAQLRKQQATFESQINILEPELNQMKIDYEKFSAELQSAKQQESPLLKQLKVQEEKSKKTKADPATVKSMTAVVESHRKKYIKAAAVAGEKQAKVDELTEAIKEKTSGKMKTIDKKLKDTISTIDKCKSEITRLQVGIKTSQRNVKKSTEKIAQMEQDITDAENKLRAMKVKSEETEKDAQLLINAIEQIVDKQSDVEQNITELKNTISDLTKDENKIKADKIEVDEKCKGFNKVIREKKTEIQAWKSKISQLKLQNIPDKNIEELQTYSVEQLKSKDVQNAQRELHANEERLKTIKPNLSAIADYHKKQEIFIGRSKQLNEISNKKATVQNHLDNVRLRRKEEFITGYNIIRLKLKEMYQMITLGGDADFEMVDTFDPFTEGIQFNVRPPKKSWKNISNLSGGEKTLSSLALVFALHYYKPSPLYVMDEIDAALDFKNVSIVGNYIKERTKDAQFIIISLRPNMFELCDYLIGIYKIFNCTRSQTIDPRAFKDDKDVESAPPVIEVDNQFNQVDNVENGQSRNNKRKSNELSADSDDESEQCRVNGVEESIVIDSSLREEPMDVDDCT